MRSGKSIIKKIVDAGMTVLLLCLMAYQVTGEVAHEWGGIAMTVLVIIHQILNSRWYGALFKGKYNPYRILTTVVNTLLIASFILTAFCGMSMSGHAVPFMYGMAKVSFVRPTHLSMSHWAFVLMGLHLGLHVRVMLPKKEIKKNSRTAITILFTILSGIGFWLFLKNNMPDYLFFKMVFAFLDYEKAGILVFLENILALLFFVFTGYLLSLLLVGNKNSSKSRQRHPFISVVCILAAVVIGLVMNAVLSSGDNGSEPWGVGAPDTAVSQEASTSNTAVSQETSISNTAVLQEISTTKEEIAQMKELEDGYLLISGGTYSMGSPETENWRIFPGWMPCSMQMRKAKKRG